MACLYHAWKSSVRLVQQPHIHGSFASCIIAHSPKTIKVLQADQHQRQINAGTLRDVFEIIFAPLQDPAHDGVPIDCTDGKVRRCFPILAAWIADHMENITLQGIKSNLCPRCEVPAVELGTNMKVYPVRDHAIYHHYDYEN